MCSIALTDFDIHFLVSEESDEVIFTLCVSEKQEKSLHFPTTPINKEVN